MKTDHVHEPKDRTNVNFVQRTVLDFYISLRSETPREYTSIYTMSCRITRKQMACLWGRRIEKFWLKRLWIYTITKDLNEVTIQKWRTVLDFYMKFEIWLSQCFIDMASPKGRQIEKFWLKAFEYIPRIKTKMY